MSYFMSSEIESGEEFIDDIESGEIVVDQSNENVVEESNEEVVEEQSKEEVIEEEPKKEIVVKREIVVEQEACDCSLPLWWRILSWIFTIIGWIIFFYLGKKYGTKYGTK